MFNDRHVSRFRELWKITSSFETSIVVHLWDGAAGSLVVSVGFVTEKLQDQIPELTRQKSVVLAPEQVNPLFLWCHLN
jgi:hypothetical protein